MADIVELAAGIKVGDGTRQIRTAAVSGASSYDVAIHADSSEIRRCDRRSRPGYVNALVQDWLPSLDGVVDKLNAGARATIAQPAYPLHLAAAAAAGRTLSGS